MMSGGSLASILKCSISFVKNVAPKVLGTVRLRSLRMSNAINKSN